MSDYQTAFGRSPPPNLNQWLKFAHTNNCSTSIGHYTQIYEDLGPWLQTGIISKDLKFPKYRQEQTFTFQDAAFSLPTNAHNITSYSSESLTETHRSCSESVKAIRVCCKFLG
ncbi:hypothetical protein BDR26DRAFT_914102 [Obelidium mucronatum]|nr:hypothetical protein BDR26DRAFT_914102 [Obelidium mucronatum]